jgi:hypothetical protein
LQTAWIPSKIWQRIEVPIICKQGRVQESTQGGEHHVNLRQNTPTSAQIMVNFGINLGYGRFEGPGADLPKKRCKDAAIMVPMARSQKPHFQLAEDRYTCSQSMAAPA